MSFCVTKDLNLQRSALQFLLGQNPNVDPNGYLETFGGVLSNLNYAWLVNGPRFIIVSCKNGARVGSWDFGNTLQDDTAEIVGIDEIQRPHGKEPLLAISLNCDTSGGIICIFDFIGSKIIRAIQICEHISSLHVIDSGQDIFNLSGPLRNFDGIFAVGTVGGNVFIVDICWQLCYEGFGTLQARDELNPCQMQIVTSQDLVDIENHKKAALCNEAHLTIHLNVVYNNTTQHFVLKEPSGADKVHVNKKEVLISALHYCPQLGSILVGYNFGAFQLWNLMEMKLIYTSPICDDHVPISKFAVQEPADDPRAFCYIWAVYSSDDLHSSLLPYLVMYALCYESKEMHEAHGILYENFQYCAVRFHMELGFNNQSIVNPKGGKCLRLESLVHKNLITNSEMCLTDGSEDVLSLCIFVWKVLCENGQYTYMAVFDLNQWYKAQMPNSLNFDDCSSYMITLSVTDLIETAEGNTEIYDVAVNRKSIHQFMGTQRLEEHYHPCSLSFDTYCLMGNRSIAIQYQGIQKALLYQLQSSGPLCLIRPTEIYQEIISLGLTPLFVEISTSPSSSQISLNSQREAILNVALEQQLVSWLCKCASEWANGSFTSAGCSLELLTSWAYRRGLVLKNNCDSICVPLFDYSEVRLDTNTSNILNNCIRQIKNISFFHWFIMKNLSTYVINKDSLWEQCHTLQMVEVYFDVLQWLLNVGLLPESSSSNIEENILENRIRAPYPADNLMQYYKKRRSELLLSLNKRFYSKTSILFIDNLIDIECGGDKLWKEWKNDGGDGFYPPMSLQALLRTYLMDDIEVCNKHAVVIYLFLDLAMILEPKKYASVITHLIKFPAVFKVSPSLIKITQAFWQLDHGDFSTAMEQLLDPLVNQDDLKYWHHKVALKSLLVQEQHNSALLYMHVRKPPILDDEDVLCSLSLFISNNMLDEAFYLEKHYKNNLNSANFMKHLFTECSNYGRLNSIIYRNLSDEEEKIFLQYLDDVKHPEAADLKITYFMQRSHYIEAFKTYKSCEEDPSKKGLVSRLNSSARDQIIHSYRKLLPTVSYKFIESCTIEPNPTFWKEVSRPEPLSVTVNGTEQKPEYKSSLIFAALAKAKQTFSNGDYNISSLMSATTEEIPFLRTPTLASSRKRSSVQVIIPKVLNQEEDGPSPKKRPKLSPKSISLLSRSNISIESSILHTPMITRKKRREISPIQKTSGDLTATPTSILKVKRSFIEEELNDNITSTCNIAESSNTILNSEQGSFISGRKSISRTSTVRFDVPKASTSSEELTSSLIKSTSLYETESQSSKINDSNSLVSSSKNRSRSLTPKNVSDSDEVFYSPNSSLNNIEEIPKDEEDMQPDNLNNSIVNKHLIEEHNENSDPAKADVDLTELNLKISPKKPTLICEAKLVKLVDYDPSSSSRENTCSSSPSARKSYKKLPDERISLRSSPRLRRNQQINTSETILESEKASRSKRERGGGEISTLSFNETLEEGVGNREFSSSVLQLKPRKSLNRQVLENNAASRILSNTESTNNSITKVFHSNEKDLSAISMDNKKSELTCTKTEYADTYIKQSKVTENFVEHHSRKTIFSSIKETVLDSDQDSSILSLGNTSQKNDHDDLISDSFMEELVENLRERRSQETSFLGQTEKQSQKENSDQDSSILSLGNTSQKNDHDDLISDSFMEELVENLRERRSRETSFLGQTEKQSQKEKASNILKKETPPRITRRLSRRLSMDRTLLSEDNSHTSTSTKDNKRLSENRTLSTDSPFKTTNKGRLTPERSTSSSHHSQSYTSDLERSKSDIPSSTASPIISKRSSLERTISSGNESQIHSKIDVLKTQRFSRRLSTERTLSSDVSNSSSQMNEEENHLIKITSKLKCRKSLGRQVLENNTLSRLVSEYQFVDKEDTLTEINENQEDFKPIFDSHSNLNSPSLDKTHSSLSDTLLEEIAFGQLSNERNMFFNQVQTLDKSLENKNEHSLTQGQSESPQPIKEVLDIHLNERRKNPSEQINREKVPENSKTISETPLLIDGDNRNIDLIIDHETSFNQADITDDLDLEPDNLTRNDENISLQTELTDEVNNEEIKSQQQEIIRNGKRLEEGDETDNNMEHHDFSIVYNDLSNDSIKKNDPELNIFEISDDLSLKESMAEKGPNFPQSELTSDLDIMMQESPLPSVFERNIMYSESSDSENDIPVDQSECLKPRSDLSSAVIEIGSSSEDTDGKSVTSQVSSKCISEESNRTLSDYNSTLTNSDTKDKNVPLHDTNVRNRSKNEEKLITSEVYSCEKEEKCGFTEKHADNSGEHLSKTNENKRDETIEISSMDLKTLPDISFIVQPEKTTFVEDNKRSIELQTGKSLLEIKKDDLDDVFLTLHDDDAKNKSEKNVPSRRMTRRRSKLLEENDSESGSFEQSYSLRKTEDLPMQDVKEAPILLRSHRSRLSIEPASPSQVNLKIELPVITASTSKAVKTYSRKRTGSVDESTLGRKKESSSSTSRMPEVPQAKRKLRSASVDYPMISESVPEISKSGIKKTSSLSDLEVIKEEKKSRRKPSKVVKRNLIESYSKTRRLTRLQCNILESTLKEADEEIDENEIDLTALEPNNRIELLDKSNFEGTPDPEEEKMYETSTSSISMSSSVSNIEPVRRLSRSSSNASEHSNARSKLSATKKTKSSASSVDSSKVKVTRIRLRSASADEKEDSVKKISHSKKINAGAKTSVASDNSSKRNRKSTNPQRFGVSDKSTKSRKRKGTSESTLSQIKEEN